MTEEGLIEESILTDSVEVTQELKTPEEVERSISAAYDSVDLIKKLELLEDPTQADVDSILRNRRHITIMLGMEWFVSALTPEQLEELSNYKAVE